MATTKGKSLEPKRKHIWRRINHTGHKRIVGSDGASAYIPETQLMAPLRGLLFAAKGFEQTYSIIPYKDIHFSGIFWLLVKRHIDLVG